MTEEDLPRQTPTLVFVAGRDNLVDSEYSRRLFDGRGNVQVEYVADGLHGVSLMGSKIFDYMSEFVNSVS
jgi:hypothetical protein